MTDQPDGRSWTKAGSWYPSDPTKLSARVKRLLDNTDAKVEGKAYALLTPHAGLEYSGPTAAEVWARADVGEVVIILAPNHFREGARMAIWDGGPWHIPGHAFATDKDLTARALHHMPALTPSRRAFMHHEVEMQLPFLAERRPDARLVVIGLKDNEKGHFRGVSPAAISNLGDGLAAFLQELEDAGTDFTLVITVDLTHYQPLAVAEEHDPVVLEAIQNYDVDKIYSYVKSEKVTTCAEFPAAVGMHALAKLGKKPMQWTTLGSNLHKSKDPESVVGYPGGVLWK